VRYSNLITILPLLFAAQLGATTLNFDKGSTGNKDASGNLIYPYLANIGGQELNTFCNDYTHDISVGDSFAVNISTISNLQLTICALSMRAADHIAGRLRAREL
jgi:hypothetical protein